MRRGRTNKIIPCSKRKAPHRCLGKLQAPITAADTHIRQKMTFMGKFTIYGKWSCLKAGINQDRVNFLGQEYCSCPSTARALACHHACAYPRAIPHIRMHPCVPLHVLASRPCSPLPSPLPLSSHHPPCAHSITPSLTCTSSLVPHILIRTSIR